MANVKKIRLNSNREYNEGIDNSILFMSLTAKVPIINPTAPPMANWRRKLTSTPPMPIDEEVTNCIKAIVSIYAIGSLLPLSSSRVLLRLYLRFMFWDLRILNTDAESVDDMVAANNMEVANGRYIFVNSNPEIKKINNPVMTAVKSTPTVDRAIPCQRMGLISLYWVSIPPEKRMMLKAIIPMNCAISTLKKWIMPRPLSPKAIPTIRKSSRDGIPNLEPVLPTSILTKMSMEPMRMIFVAVIGQMAYISILRALQLLYQ